MVNRTKWLRTKGARITVIALVCVWLAWSIIANTMADRLAALNPEAALAWRSSHSAALIGVADRELQRDDAKDAVADIEGLARKALMAVPLEVRALRDLGLAAELDGKAADAGRLMALADRRTRRDEPTQLWLFSHSLVDRRFGEALAHADALLRTQPDLADELGSTLIAFARDNDARDALIATLAANPPWRPWLLGQISRANAEMSPGLVFDIYSRLAESDHPPADDELRPFLNQLVATGQYELGFLTWLHFLPNEPGRSIRYVYNGDFERPLTGAPFDWIAGRVQGATTEVVAEAEDNHVLRVEFANTRVPYRHLSKLLLLPPGSYRLSGRARAERLENDRGLEWQVSCAEGDQQNLGETVRLSGTEPWHSFEMGFTVPTTECRAQWLRLKLAARTALEQQISGSALYDDVAIERKTDG